MVESGFVRTEVWHALSVHFPIALLLFSTLAMMISFIVKIDIRNHWQNAASGLLIAGCLTAWISIYTGNLADGIVARKICDPTILKDHAIAAQAMTYLFTIASLLGIVQLLNVLNIRLQQVASWLMLVIMLLGSGYLIHTGHLGASLVYQQGAGVQNHSVDCID